MAMIYYAKGDATKPIGAGPKMICHITNNRGGWGAGFVLALSKRWLTPELEYRRSEASKKLGNVQIVEVEPDLFVANMCAQDGYKSYNNPMPFKPIYLEKCLERLAMYAQENSGMSFHMPRIGCGLGGGNWDRDVVPLLQKCLVDKGYDVHVYVFK